MLSMSSDDNMSKNGTEAAQTSTTGTTIIEHETPSSSQSSATQKRKVQENESDNYYSDGDGGSTNSKKQKLDGFSAATGSELFEKEPAKSVPESAEQLATLLVPLESARTILLSKLPLREVRSLLTGAWIRYHAMRQNNNFQSAQLDQIKDPKKDFFVDRVIHVNRDGLRFMNSRENSYRNIQKLKECDIQFDQEAFEFWREDMRKWNQSLPPITDLETKQKIVSEAIEELKKSMPQDEQPSERLAAGEAESITMKNGKSGGEKEDVSTSSGSRTVAGDQTEAGTSSGTESISLTCEQISNLVITLEELIQLLDYGKATFERVVTGFYVEIRAPPNPRLQRLNPTIKADQIYMDQIIGVNWMGKPYVVLGKTMTLCLKFRHFRDEKLRILPYRDRKNDVDDAVFKQWLEDMREWEEELPDLEFIEQKSAELVKTFSSPPTEPPIDLDTVMSESGNSKKQLRRIEHWQRQQQRLLGKQPRPNSSYPPSLLHSPVPAPPRYPPAGMHRQNPQPNHWGRGAPMPPPPTSNWQYPHPPQQWPNPRMPPMPPGPYYPPGPPHPAQFFGPGHGYGPPGPVGGGGGGVPPPYGGGWPQSPSYPPHHQPQQRRQKQRGRRNF